MSIFMVLRTPGTKLQEIDEAVEKVVGELSPSVRRIRYQFGEDWTGEPVIFFRVLLSDNAVKRRNLRKIAPLVVSRMTDEFFAIGLGLIPHFNFRSEAEQAKAHEPAWA
jgi:hypothetical protein